MRPFTDFFARVRGLQGRLVAVMVGPPLIPVLLVLGCALVWGIGIVRSVSHAMVAQRAALLSRTLERRIQHAVDVGHWGNEELWRRMGILGTAWIAENGTVGELAGIMQDKAVFAGVHWYDPLGPLLAAREVRRAPVPGVVLGRRYEGGVRCVYLELRTIDQWVDEISWEGDHVVLDIAGYRMERGPVAGEGWTRASAILSGLPWSVEVAASEGWTLSPEKWLGLFLVAALVGGGMVVVGLALHTSGAVAKLLAQYDAEQDALRQALTRAEILAQLGGMAAGFAHEINNPLQIMKSEQAYMRLLLDNIISMCPQAQDPCRELQESMQQCEGQIQRCSRITHAILGFGRLSAGESQILDICRFVSEVASTFRSMADAARVRFDIHCPHSPVYTRLDPGKLQQVLSNLITNAIHAVEGREEPRVMLRVMERDNNVRIIVGDNGCGIPAEHHDAIFTPFFTTKGPDQGTGLGLPICHALVQAMGGSISFESEVGRGTRFMVDLPRLRASR